MDEPALTPERILEAAEEVLRRYGPEKATVVDVARAPGVAHGSVYRHSRSKAAPRDAVVRRRLETMMPPLEAVVAEEGSAPARLRRWLELLIAARRRRATEDPELFATDSSLKTQMREVVPAHVDALVGQAARIIADGVARGEFTAADPVAAGRAVLRATTRFYGPAHAAEWSDPAFGEDFDQVWHLLVSGLGVREPSKGARDRDAARPGRIKRVSRRDERAGSRCGGRRRRRLTTSLSPAHVRPGMGMARTRVETRGEPLSRMPRRRGSISRWKKVKLPMDRLER